LGQTGQKSCQFNIENNRSTYNLALSYHIYNKDGTIPCPTYRYVYEGQFRATNYCFERTRMLLCDSDANKQLLPGGQLEVGNITIALPTGEYGLPLKDNDCYTLRWDMEVKNSHLITDEWLSRIHPDYTKDDPTKWTQPTALWPTQDIEICYNPSGNQPGGKIAPPTIEKGAEQGWHDKEITVDVAWKPPALNTLPSGVSITGYKYEYTGNGGQVNIQSKGFQRLASEGSIPDPKITAATFWFVEDGEHKICLYSVANNGEVSENGSCLSYKIDKTYPTVTLNALPAELHGETNLIWTSVDEGSGIAKTRLQYKHNEDEWQEIAFTSENISPYLFSFPNGQQNDLFEFQVTVCDVAGNCTTPDTVSTIYKPNPELQFNQAPIVWVTTPAEYPKTEILTLSIYNIGGGTLNWTAQKDLGDYLTLRAPVSGQVANCEGQLFLELIHPGDKH